MNCIKAVSSCLEVVNKMAEYILHQSALDAIEAERKVVHHESQMECTKESCHDEYVITRALERLAIRAQIIPAADVRPVVRGRWAHLGGDEWCCTACGFVIHTEGSWEKPEKKFCEDCGADMRGGEGENAV